jgi:hypothetical protein
MALISRDPETANRRRRHRWLLRHRRAVAAALTAVGVVAAIGAIRAEPEGYDVTLAARDLPSGHVLKDTDLTTVRVTARHQLKSLDREAAPGRIVALRAQQGEVINASSTINPRKLPEGQVVAAIPVDMSVARITRPGDRVDVLALADNPGDEGGDTAREVATGVTVLVVDVRGDVAVVGVAAEPESARVLATAALQSRLTVINAAP